jgi:Uma2 family endonuclease
MAIPAHRLFTAEEFLSMGEAGILGEDERVELLDGEIVPLTPIGPTHAGIVDRLTRVLARVAADRAILRVQSPIRLTDLSLPQPDLALLRPREDFYVNAHPQAGDVLLVVEVADSSVRWDREVKVPLYARSGVCEVWVVDAGRKEMFVCRGPEGGRYAEEVAVGRGDVVEPVGVDGAVELSEVFGEL